MKPAVVHFDGGCRPSNPGIGSFGYTIEYNDILLEGSNTIGHTTSNVAEYCGLISALRRCITIGVSRVHIFGDSRLVIDQINKKIKAKNIRMQKLLAVTHDLLNEFDEWKATWISRDFNNKTDKLAEDVRSN